MIIIVKAVPVVKAVDAAKTTAAAPTAAPAETVTATSFKYCFFLFSSSFPVSSSFNR